MSVRVAVSQQTFWIGPLLFVVTPPEHIPCDYDVTMCGLHEERPVLGRVAWSRENTHIGTGNNL